ncbi:MAG: carbamoyltransferase HypF [Chloroflexota bacterium]|nr:carbamoyltransferase HypF [Chloroflexota bacterium]
MVSRGAIADLTPARARVVVRGIVQGVGFRPFVHRLAHEYGLKGWVLNSTEGVVIEVEGLQERLEAFVGDLEGRPPPRALVEKVEANFLPPLGYTSFTIEASLQAAAEFVLISPDIALCPDCLRELFTPGDRRFHYPFINCTNCGPRFTIIKDIPYDRPKTTMAVFPMCPQCEHEYHDPADRRFHAQPNACSTCGPRVWLAGREESLLGESDTAIPGARRLLARGAILAVKGIGGFHLACSATEDAPVALLRERKRRVNKPLAIMSLDCDEVERYCHLDEGERQLLESPQRPIVLLRRRPGGPISPLVAPGNRHLGVMLPYTPLHYLLLEKRDGETDMPALVMTSGNMSEEPIAKDNEEARERLGVLADAFLFHNRDIHLRCDDSVTRVFEGKEFLMRRSRGYAPFPVRLPFEVRPGLACGAHLKNTFCLTRDNYAFLSQHIGDLENLETLASFESGIEHFKKLFRVDPEVIAYDLHPEYLSTRYALELMRKDAAGVQFIAVQHHHAHVASCLADNGLVGPAIGVAWDGTGYGEDGQVWGGEFLIADYRGFRRVAHLKYLPLPGGEAAIRKPSRMALSYLSYLPRESVANLPLLTRVTSLELAVVRKQIEERLNSPLTSSMGRLFDAVSSVLGICDAITYEGQAALELETVAEESVDESYCWPVARRGFPLVLDWAFPLKGVISDLKAGVPVPVISARFHNSVAGMLAEACSVIRERTGLNQVALSGGVFQNTFLLKRALRELRNRGFEPFIQHQVPCNDGGISLGQAVVANARLQARTAKGGRSIHVPGRAS